MYHSTHINHQFNHHNHVNNFNQLNHVYNTSDSDSYDSYDDSDEEKHIKNILYSEWVNSVAAIVYIKIKLDLQDLPDEDYRNNFEEGVSSSTMAKMIVDNYLKYP